MLQCGNYVLSTYSVRNSPESVCHPGVPIVGTCPSCETLYCGTSVNMSRCMHNPGGNQWQCNT